MRILKTTPTSIIVCASIYDVAAAIHAATSWLDMQADGRDYECIVVAAWYESRTCVFKYNFRYRYHNELLANCRPTPRP